MALSEKAKEIVAMVIEKRATAADATAEENVQKMADEIEKMRKDMKDKAQGIHDHAAAMGAEGHGSADDDDDDDAEKVFKMFGIDPVAAGIKKAGMRHSKGDKEHLDAIHKMSKDMGADCDMNKYEESSAIQKMDSKLDAMTKAFALAIEKMGSAPVANPVATRLIGKGDVVGEPEVKKAAELPALPARVDAKNPGDFKIVDSHIQKALDGNGVPLREWL
jgi:hypothetical protein